MRCKLSSQMFWYLIIGASIGAFMFAAGMVFGYEMARAARMGRALINFNLPNFREEEETAKGRQYRL
jgi:hypothetical protein